MDDPAPGGWAAAAVALLGAGTAAVVALAKLRRPRRPAEPAQPRRSVPERPPERPPATLDIAVLWEAVDALRADLAELRQELRIVRHDQRHGSGDYTDRSG